MNKKTVVYPGTFDPTTLGHIDIISRAAKLFDKVIVAVSLSKNKKTMFDLNTRVKMMHLALENSTNIIIESFDGLLIDFMKSHHSSTNIRGLRAVSDFEYELQMGYVNRNLDPNIDTLYLMPHLSYIFISSTMVRNLIMHKGSLKNLVPEVIAEYIENYQKNKPQN